METHKKQTTKSGRATLPFYSPPTRHYGQTPSEIIREARASVMCSPTPGIKPVLTSRPFTPKEKERTLFGNVKKRLSRPPSSFSLRYLQKPEALPRIKLPAIGGGASQKSDCSSKFRSVHSLDNLIEEYEAELLEEAKQWNFKDLPFFRKSYSSPQERKMHRATSLSDSIPSKVPEKRSIYTISQGNILDNVSYMPDVTHCDSLERSQLPSEVDKWRLNQFNEDKPSFESKHSNSEMERKLSSEKSRKVDDANNAIEKKDKIDNTLQEQILINEKINIYDTSNSKRNTTEVEFTKSAAEVKKKKAELDETIKVKDERNQKIMICHAEGSSDNIYNSGFSDSEDLNVHGMSSEKSVSTETVSEYLALSTNRPSSVLKNEGQKVKEILDLYEVAEYYGVPVESKRGPVIEKAENPAEQYQEGPDNEMESTQKNSADFLHMVKANIETFDLKMKKLNDSMELFGEKLNERNPIYTSGGSVESDENSSWNSEFKMNSLRRNHIIEERVNRPEKYISNLKHMVMTKEENQNVGWDGFWKNSYYRQNEEMDNEQYILRHLDQYITKLIEINRMDSKNGDVIEVTTEIYKLLRKYDHFNKKQFDNETKIKILRSLYNFADKEDPEILGNLARIVFTLKMETSLTAACKMVFKVARSDVNDHLFLELDDLLELFLEGIGLASPLDAPECCIYGYGALKFLTMNHRILSRLVRLGVLDLLILHLKIINSAKVEGIVVKEQTQHALYQMTGALRNIAAGDGVLPLFITTNAIPVLTKTLRNFRYCEDLVTNISRILSLLSADEDTIQTLMSIENILAIIIELIEYYKTNDKILIRLSYCLGNIVAYSDLARVQLSRSESSVIILLKILQFYVDKDLELTMKENSKDQIGEEAEVVDDVIVKVVRIIANMCMNPVAGSNLSPAEGNEKNSLKLSQLLTVLLQRKDPGITLLACLGCLNNISYYCGSHSSLMDITEGIIRVLGLHDEECQAEAARVLGNLTRHKDVRDLICNTGGIEQLAVLLDSKDKEVYRSACGALVNLMLDNEPRQNFVESNGIDKLVDGLEKFTGDWSFAGLICRAIWNSCAEDMHRVMANNNLERLLTILASALDEENWNDGDPAWEEFAALATDLLEKINVHLESL